MDDREKEAQIVFALTRAAARISVDVARRSEAHRQVHTKVGEVGAMVGGGKDELAEALRLFLVDGQNTGATVFGREGSLALHVREAGEERGDEGLAFAAAAVGRRQCRPAAQEANAEGHHSNNHHACNPRHCARIKKMCVVGLISGFNAKRSEAVGFAVSLSLALCLLLLGPSSLCPPSTLAL